MNRRDKLLNEMGIQQWVLVKPHVLKGDAQIRLAREIKFVVVSEEDHTQSPLFQDILRSLHLQAFETQWFNWQQSQRLVIEHSPLVWLLQAESKRPLFAKTYPNLTACQTESWQALQNPKVKRAFWQQIEPFSQGLQEENV